MTLEPKTGDPVAEGRYLVFFACFKPAPRGWFVEPGIATWHGNRWHSVERRRVLGWIGPIPIFKKEYFDPPEYDL